MAAGRTVLRGTFRADALESVNPIEFIGLSQFEEMRVARRRSLIDLKSVYGLSNLRDVQTTAGSATITNSVGSGEYKLTTTASGTDSATLESAERGRYIAGFSAEAGIGIRRSGTFSGNLVARWGYFDDDDGFGFGEDATGLFVFTRKSATDTIVRQADWNNDTLDGTGPSRLTLDTSKGQVFQIVFTYYGYGSVEFQVIIADSDNRQRVIVAHRFKQDNALSVENPNLPVRAEIDNDGTATAFDSLYVGGRQFSVVGDYSPNRRISSERRLSLGSVGTTIIPIISMRRKSAYESVSVKVDGVDIITDADLVYELRLNGSLTSPSYGTPTNYTASETALEADTAASAITGGEVLYSGIVDAGNGSATGSMTIAELGFDLAALQPISLCVGTVSGTATVSAVLRMREEW